MKNYYTDKPLVPYRKTQVEMAEVIAYIQGCIQLTEVKRAAYIIFRNESGNGKSGLNNNYGGFQADSGRWNAMYDELINGVVIKAENGTGNTRAFLSFISWKASIDMLMDRLKERGIYVGGTTWKVTKEYIDSPEELALYYKREWVTGNKNATLLPAEKNSFLSMYRQSEKLFV